ncbi:L-ribulose-5-phosphate 3-epimerase [Cutibacterium avidum]|uniref:Xylulose 5-phosphate 3-epimerase n=1 Tax=Cutibacterium avidum TaxID=33010 RepID=A0A3E2DAR4_9ACTN|nr:L-ribulose-5-phosphate 3-epimerase [Cutibacterium avidum]MBS5745036.1 L-ribulose-5-phosphate 3-epimerase [Propionibacterium sp.]MDU2096210.1 L-ribulose-5-phosphate 3-epimerase [Negativicoccus succinicivorans]MDU7816005.1 L-ribulose-5-phosphate 3-epimerase [Bacillota bacterium]MDK7358593.1 L-ribulose-5-phosphate 3-epimerase [Cutibacterium avidum]MDK7373798.1 L-ribulose-5-phosphate 3-epimerase [Cutibacterium avidum]
MIEPLSDGVTLGIYEKALVGNPLETADDWRRFLIQVPESGFGFVDLSIDETEERTARLEWDQNQRRMVRHCIEETETTIGGICLSVHRRIGPGSADPTVRQRAREVMAEGLQLCHDLGVPVLQVAGYYCYYEQMNDQSEQWYTDLLIDAVPMAARLGVVMGIENVDGTDVTSIRKAMEFVKLAHSPYLQVYPDIGNIAEQQLDATIELEAGRGHMVAIHVKDVRPGEPRRVPMGEGTVDWDDAFAILAKQGWRGRMMIEMWNDDAPDSSDRSVSAREFIEERLRTAGIPVRRTLA